ncbi:insulinase family protein [Alphaproteobacteria bacterium GH1-50]|uniref:Insulinase family protein n=1 Tax=Kangsaoukella pontilimi TaxID=2691042 RepID=A0A7C9NF42_9RHOB|nr:pitrilysin family protein [Kangsaoukella pontilimi]MXQ08579.1 insulinase family protein [Kangsaoukella pontilimi]
MRNLIAAFVSIALLPVAAQSVQAADVSTFELENGLEIVVLEDHRAPAVVHMVWYRVGSADEAPGKSGIAHFLEHLMFKATDELEAGELSETVALNGGSDNAFTSYDYTAYFQRVAADRLELMMRMEASRMDGLALVPEDIATERDVVIEERNQRTENEPGALFGEQRRAAQYLNHAYGRPIIGWKHEAEALTLEDAQEFYEAHYGPNNAILIVAGDVEPEEVLRLAEQYYGVIPPNPNIVVPRQRVEEPPQLAERRIIYEDPRIANPYVIRTYMAPERDPGAQEEAAALTLLAEVLGGSGTTSVLAEKLQFETQQALYTSAFYSGQSLDDTNFGLVILPADGFSLEQAEEALDGAVAEFLEEGVDPEALDRIKMQIRASQIYAEDDISGLARRYGSALTSGLTVEDVQAWPDILDAVTGEDIIAAARRVFDRRNAVTGWAMPAPATGTDEVTQ